MVSRIVFFIAALLLPAQAMAQAVPPASTELPVGTLEGHWALRIDDATIFVFRLDEMPDGSWQGAWKRPARISSNGAVFRNMGGLDIAFAIAAIESGGEVQLTFAGPQGNSRNDVLRFRWDGINRARLTYVGIPGEPYPLIRVAPDTELGPFEDSRIYDRDRAVADAPFEEALAGNDDGTGEDMADNELVESEDASEAELASEEMTSEDGAADEAAFAVQAGPSQEVLAVADGVDEPEGEASSAVQWEPLGLVDALQAERAAEAAEDAPEPATLPPLDAPDIEAAEEAEEPAVEEEPGYPRIDADFLDGL